MPTKSSQPSLLGMFMPEQVRSPRRKRPLGIPSTSEMRYVPPQLWVIRGMSAYRELLDSVLFHLGPMTLGQRRITGLPFRTPRGRILAVAFVFLFLAGCENGRDLPLTSEPRTPDLVRPMGEWERLTGLPIKLTFETIPSGGYELVAHGALGPRDKPDACWTAFVGLFRGDRWLSTNQWFPVDGHLYLPEMQGFGNLIIDFDGDRMRVSGAAANSRDCPLAGTYVRRLKLESDATPQN